LPLPFTISKTIPGLQALLETLGVVSADGKKADQHVYIPAVSLAVLINADGTITTVVNNAAPAPAVGAGFLVGVGIGNPGAGTDYSFTLATMNAQSSLSMARARIRAVSVDFATTAGVFNRQVSLIQRLVGDSINAGPATLAQWPMATAEVASNGGRHLMWVEGLTAEFVDTAAIPNHMAPFSGDLWLTNRVAWQIGTRTINLQAGDTFSNFNLLVEGYSS
jgi:hypothetical protein